MSLTKQDHLQLARFILRYQDKHGFPPTCREIQRGLQLSSTCVVHHRLKRLRELGLLTHRADTARGIYVNRYAVEHYVRSEAKP